MALFQQDQFHLLILLIAHSIKLPVCSMTKNNNELNYLGFEVIQKKFEQDVVKLANNVML